MGVLESLPLCRVGDSSLQQRLTVAREPLLVRVEPRRATDEADLAMPCLGERSHRVGGSLEVLEHDRVGDQVVRGTVDADDGGAQLALTFKVGLVSRDGNHEHRPNALLEQRLDDSLLAGGIIVG